MWKVARRVTLGAVLVALIALWWIRSRGRTDPLAGCSVVSMKAFLTNSPRQLPDVPWFEVPAEHVSLVLASLEPAKLEPQPAFWTVMGRLECKCADGNMMTVDSYKTGDAVGAFSVVSTRRGAKRYYRAGTDESIEEAIRAAYAASKK